MAVDASGDLLQVMASVDLVKTPPLLRGERAEDGMVEHTGAGAKSLFRVAQRGIHGDQGIVKTAQRFIPQTTARHDLFGRLDTSGKAAESQNIEAADAMAKTGAGGFRLSRLDGAKQSLSGGGVGEHEVLEQLQRIPLILRCTQQRLGGNTASCAIGLAADELQFWRQLTSPR